MRHRALALASIIAVVVACDTTEPRVPAAVEVDQATLSLEVGDTVVVQAAVVDQHGRTFDVPPEGFEIAWASSQPGVATVTDGEIAAVGIGAATITATAGTLPAAQVQVTVEARTVSAQISFSYSGHRSGSFAVDETFSLGAPGHNFAWSIYAVENGTQFTDVEALRLRDDGLYDFIWFWVDGHITTPGTRPGDGILVLGWDFEAEAWENLYWVESGSVNHTSVTAARMAGTFSFTMEEDELEEVLNLTNGSFDLPIVTEGDFGGQAGAVEGRSAVVLPEALLQLRGEVRANR